MGSNPTPSATGSGVRGQAIPVRPRRWRGADTARNLLLPSGVPLDPLHHPCISAVRRSRILAAGLILAALFAYWPVFHAGFIWDDDILLIANAQLQSAQGLADIWLGRSCEYTPLTSTTFWIETRLWKTEPLGYHIVNVLLHALAGILLWRILAALKVPGSWLAALLFIVHPVNVASVAWIAERKNTLSAVLFLGAILLFLRWDEIRYRRTYLGAVGLFLLANLAKGAVVTMPLVLIGALIWRHGRIRRADLVRLLPFGLVAAGFAVVTVHYQARAVDYQIPAAAFLYRLARAGFLPWIYLGQLVLPAGLSPMVPLWRPNLYSAVLLLPPLTGLSLGAVCWWKRQTWGKPVLLIFICYVAMLLPVLGLVWMTLQQQVAAADWWQYLAAPVAFAGTGAGFALVLATEKRSCRLTSAVALGLVLGLLLVQTWRRAAIYESMETYCRAVLAEDPHLWSLQTNLGIVFRQRAQLEDAVRCYRRALADNPRYAQAHNNLGNVLAVKGQWTDAEAELESAAQLEPGNPQIASNLSRVYFREGKVLSALAASARATKLDPCNPERYAELGEEFSASNRFDRAAACFQDARLLDPGNVRIQTQLVEALLGDGRNAAAARVCEQALRAAAAAGDNTGIATLALLRAHCRDALHQ